MGVEGSHLAVGDGVEDLVDLVRVIDGDNDGMRRHDLVVAHHVVEVDCDELFHLEEGCKSKYK